MKIKKLELSGFKSFRDKTVIEFDSSITGIVGPNGCGKSNIVDAFCWVMGEMSAKTLRGSSMDDVIFKGADGYPPSGMAEVSLTLEQGSDGFPIKFSNLSELQLTRRLHRTGQSEYLINSKPSRLRDIQEIFMDASAGGLSIIEQGAIGSLVVAKPEERRVLIEEAAGITKFRSRKNQALRKLEATENNLARVSDIINESKRQLNFLERQAKKAKKYKTLKESARELDLTITLHKYKELSDELALYNKNVLDYQTDVTGIETKISTINNFVQAKKLKISEFERIIDDSSSDLGSNKDAVRTKEDEITKITFELDEALRKKDGYSVTKPELCDKKEQLETSIEPLKKAQSELLHEIDINKDELNKLNQHYNEIKQNLNDTDNIISNNQSKIIDLDKQKSELTLKLAEANVRIEEYNRRIEDIIKKELLIKNKKTDLKPKIESLTQNLYKKNTVDRLEKLENESKTIQIEIDKKKKEVEQFKNKLSQVEGRLYSLETMHNNFEGYRTGIKSLMKKQLHADGSYSMMPIAEIVQVDKKYELAMEASLGLKLQTLVAPSNKAVLDAVDYLKKNKSGRSSFVGGYRTAMPKEKIKGDIIGMLSSFVKIDKKYMNSINDILDDVVVVENLDNAIELNKAYPEHTFVTLDGDVLSDGILTAGTPESADSGMLKRKREIDELTNLKTEWQGKLYLANEALNKDEKKLKEVNVKKEKLSFKERENEIKLVKLERELELLKKEAANLDKEQKTSLKNKEELLSLKFNLEDETQKLLQKANTVNKEYQQFSSKHNKTLFDISADRTKEKELLNDIMDKKTKLVYNTQELKNKEIRIDSIEQNILELSNNLQALDEEHNANLTSITEYDAKLSKAKEDLTKIIKNTDGLRLKQSKIINDYETLKTQIDNHSTELTGLNNECLEKNKKLNEIKLEYDRLNLQIEALKEQFETRYAIDLSCENIKENKNAEQLEDLSIELEALNQKIQKIKDVSLTSIEEYEDTLSRYTFLTEQRDDLLASKQELKKVIDKINRVCTKRFKDKFEAVNQRFQQVFPILFGGGKASIELVEPENDLKNSRKPKYEMGIDINISPPGKKLQNVNLLSGGEKALTAAALIFSVFLVKSSPFCLLDEVDAPLDDANVLRFNELIKQMSKVSQVIMVTHNKHTMEFSDKLYGVTMEDKGVSKMVSVAVN